MPLKWMQTYLQVFMRIKIDSSSNYSSLWPSFQLIQHMNERSSETGIFLTYSTPSCYLNALRQNKDLVRKFLKKTLVYFALLYQLKMMLLIPICTQVYPIKSDDFFPYASGLHSYWTGYFTSRPSIKVTVVTRICLAAMTTEFDSWNLDKSNIDRDQSCHNAWYW